MPQFFARILNMKLQTEQFKLTFDNGEIRLTTQEDRKVYVNGKLFNAPAKPKKKWTIIKSGLVKKGDSVSKDGYCDVAMGLVGMSVKRAIETGWTIRRKV